MFSGERLEINTSPRRRKADRPKQRLLWETHSKSVGSQISGMLVDDIKMIDGGINPATTRQGARPERKVGR